MINEESLERIIEAARHVRLEFIVVGNAAAFLHAAPVTTEDFDLFVRHTPRNLTKIRAFADRLGASVLRPFEPLSEMRRVVTDTMSVDFIFRLAPRQKFESVRSRAIRMKRGKYEVLVGSLEDVIEAKQFAGRQKDKIALPLLKATLRAKQQIEKEQT